MGHDCRIRKSLRFEPYLADSPERMYFLLSLSSGVKPVPTSRTRESPAGWLKHKPLQTSTPFTMLRVAFLSGLNQAAAPLKLGLKHMHWRLAPAQGRAVHAGRVLCGSNVNNQSQTHDDVVHDVRETRVHSARMTPLHAIDSIAFEAPPLRTQASHPRTCSIH